MGTVGFYNHPMNRPTRLFIVTSELRIVIQSRGEKAPRRLSPRTLKYVLPFTLLAMSACSTVEPQPEKPTNSGAASSPTETVNQFVSTVTSPFKADAKEKLTTVDKAILNDLTSVVTQIYNPIDTTIQINRNDADPIMQHFINLLIDEGFGIQRVSADQGANYASYSQAEKNIGNSQLLRFTVQIGAVSVERDYTALSKNKVMPASKVRLSGTRAPVKVIDEIAGSDPSLSGTQYVATLRLDEKSPIISLITPSLVDSVTAASTTNGPSLQGFNSSKVEVNNLFYSDTSTFSSVLDDHEKITRQIVVFGDDSMILGDTNKALIGQFVDSKMRQGDIISLIGCSNGPTNLKIGNEGLALGRAKRVTQALQARGIARASILDEGCWAPVKATDRFPSRAVVIELWRKRT